MASLDDKAKRGLEDFEAQGGSADDVISKLNQQVDQLLTEPDSPKKKKPLGGKWFILILLLLLAIAGIYMLRQILSEETDISDKVYAEHFEPFTNVIQERHRGADTETNKSIGGVGDQAMQLYDARQYTEAYELFEAAELLSEHERFYKGICALETGHIAEAIAIFNGLSQKEEFSLNDAAQWYHALSLIRMDKTEKAIAVLNTISLSSDHYKKETAQIILEQLRQ